MRRGQAFEVFRLLIAAVIAGAILMVLLNILGGVGIRTQDPQDFVNQAVQSLATTGGIKTSSVITFEKGQAILLSAAATSATLDPECVLPATQGQQSDSSLLGSNECFKVDNGLIEYVCTQKTKAKIRVTCIPETGGNTTCPVTCYVDIIKP